MTSISLLSNPPPTLMKIISHSGKSIDRPKHSFAVDDLFVPTLVRIGNTVYSHDSFSFFAPAVRCPVQVCFSAHNNGRIYRLIYDGIDFVAPSLSRRGGMGSAAALDTKRGTRAMQTKITDGCTMDTAMKHQISDVAGTKSSFYLKTRMMPEHPPNTTLFGKYETLHTDTMSDIVVVKRLDALEPGTLEYRVTFGITGMYRFGILEVLSDVVFSGVAELKRIHSKTWADVVPRREYSVDKFNGFVFGPQEDTAMGVSLVDWPRGAIAFPPRVVFKDYENFTKWSIVQRFGLDTNTNVKIPGGEYTYVVKLFFGTMKDVESKIESLRSVRHGAEHVDFVAFCRAEDDVFERMQRAKTSLDY
jgi:hypothetical protein